MRLMTMDLSVFNAANILFNTFTFASSPDHDALSCLAGTARALYVEHLI